MYEVFFSGEPLGISSCSVRIYSHRRDWYQEKKLKKNLHIIEIEKIIKSQTMKTSCIENRVRLFFSFFYWQVVWGTQGTAEFVHKIPQVDDERRAGQQRRIGRTRRVRYDNVRREHPIAGQRRQFHPIPPPSRPVTLQNPRFSKRIFLGKYKSTAH